MTNWRLKLQGDWFDLNDLAEQFPHGPRARVYKDGNDYFLELPQAGSAEDTEATALGRDALDKLTAIDRLAHPNRLPVAVNAISRFDEETNEWKAPVNIAHHASTRAGFRCGIVISNPDGTVVPPPPATDGELLLDVIDTEPHLARALYLYDRLEHDWRGLYMVLEAAEDGCGGETGLIAKPWAPYGIKSFKKTANSYNALGERARHGSTRSGIAQPEVTIEGAQQMIHQLLTAWARELRASTPPA